MDFYEKELHQRGFSYVAGVDEVGRGPLAGPVVAAAVVFAERAETDPEIDDSKKLSPAKRLRLAKTIYHTALAVGVGLAWHGEVDEKNILKATLLAMKRAVAGLATSPGPPGLLTPSGRVPDFLIIDGTHEIDVALPQQTVVRGDTKSVSIAAASIIAKTTRDRLMCLYHSIYPEYNFIKNKGYGTREHIRALKRHGPSPIHRRSFKYS